MTKIIVLAILCLSLFLRTYRLGSYPVGFLWDEAALGYNAYSILTTGQDEYGEKLPLIFKSFGDYKPGFYVYLIAPLIPVFGLNEFTVRLPSALAGTLAVWLIYLFIKQTDQNHSEIKGLLGAFFLAINPWHLNYSRGAWELNVMFTELLAAVYFFVAFVTKKRLSLGFLSVLLFLLTLITYQSAKLLLPALVAGLVFCYRDCWRSGNKRNLMLLFLPLAIGYFGFGLLTFLGGKSGRIKAMSVFSYPRSPEEKAVIVGQDKSDPILYSVFHADPVFFARSVLGWYFNHLSGRFLFIEGDWSNPRNGVIYHGSFYLVDLLFIVFGIYCLFSRPRSPTDKFMLYWLLLAPIPAALTRDSVSAIRSYTMIAPMVYLITCGVAFFGRQLKIREIWLKYSVLGLILVVYLFSFVRLLDLYWWHTPRLTSKYQTQADLSENPFGDVGKVGKLDNIEFRRVYWPADRGTKNAIFAGDDMELPLKDVIGEPDQFFVTDEIKFLNNQIAFRIVETR